MTNRTAIGCRLSRITTLVLGLLLSSALQAASTGQSFKLKYNWPAGRAQVVETLKSETRSYVIEYTILVEPRSGGGAWIQFRNLRFKEVNGGPAPALFVSNEQLRLTAGLLDIQLGARGTVEAMPQAEAYINVQRAAMRDRLPDADVETLLSPQMVLEAVTRRWCQWVCNWENETGTVGKVRKWTTSGENSVAPIPEQWEMLVEPADDEPGVVTLTATITQASAHLSPVLKAEILRMIAAMPESKLTAEDVRTRPLESRNVATFELSTDLQTLRPWRVGVERVTSVKTDTEDLTSKTSWLYEFEWPAIRSKQLTKAEMRTAGLDGVRTATVNCEEDFLITIDLDGVRHAFNRNGRLIGYPMFPGSRDVASNLRHHAIGICD